MYKKYQEYQRSLKTLKVALVHDSIGEFGGAERVLLALSEIFPEAPIYTAYKRSGETLKRLKGKRIITSWTQEIPFFATKLHSPLRFLAPFIWGSFDFSKYDLVISSASWYVTKGFGSRTSGHQDIGTLDKKPVEICYCHTPPRWLYGYDTPLGKNRGFLVNAYVSIVAHFLRMYDFQRAQKVNYFIANSQNVKRRIEKFYRREAEVVYPPVDINSKFEMDTLGRRNSKREYYLIVSRITGGKGIEMAVRVANKLKIPLKIAGAPSGYSQTYEWVKKHAGPTVELLGYVKEEELGELYAGAKAFLALQKDEDFGMTLPEAMVYGTPVIAYNGGGYPESVIDGKTGILFDEYSVEGLVGAMKRFEKTRIDPKACMRQAKKFSKERFKREIAKFVRTRRWNLAAFAVEERITER